ncbi:hypothetical protein [Sediminicola luteus]|uniref:CarboxypepD_reg-like domain-containing protein n=1 Tax=Sediminicola luteus TaxID=319238 RepID=A0A2A4G637_9FLAO|nr:hypothetical protein [Sediminicola luteus]PCE63446.1 hypothetical protein B7P33_14635 [Sediminicola luteus]
MKKFLTLFVVLVSCYAFSQDGRRLLRGQVLYRDSNVANENVINTTSGEATITNAQGRFAIAVALGDQLAFTAVNYELKVVMVTQDILDNNRLVVEVKEKVTELDEVVVGPENQKKFLELKNESFKEQNYDTDIISESENIALSQVDQGGMQDGINFVNIFKAIFKSNNKEGGEKKDIKMSQVLRQVYDDEFFVVDLGLPQNKINDFLFYCDAKVPPQSLLKKDNEFELIEFLVSQSKEYLDQADSDK